jgi:hypothetical protein
MLIVLGALALMATVPLVVISTTVNQLPLTTSNLNWNAAYEAAQAGLNDYIQQVDANPSYLQWNVNHTGCTNNPPTNEAFCNLASSPTSTSSLNTYPPEWYEYSVSNNGSVLLTVSGKAGTGSRAVVRTFRYVIAPQATLDNIYWTSSEGDVNFDSADTLYGPVFSNDDFNICGSPTFQASVSSADGRNEGTPYWQQYCSGTPTFQAGVPQLAGVENIITQSTGPDLNPAQTLGCYIAGPGTPGGPTGITVTLNGNTLTWATTSGYSTASVQNNASNPNSSTSCGAGHGTVTFSTLGSALFYVNGDITINGNGTVNGFLTLVSTGNITLDGNVTYPCTGQGQDITWSAGTCASPAGQGTDTQDALGLIAANNVNVSDNNAATQIDAAMVAIAGSFQNSAAGNNCPGGGTGNNPHKCPVLTVFGSIAQNTRGIVAYLDSNGYPDEGYSKAYFYDSSLQTLWPPFFIPPAGATWTPKNYEECKPGSADRALGGAPQC